MSIEGAAFVLTDRARAWPAHRGEVVNALALASRKPRATRTRMVLFGVGVVKAVAVIDVKTELDRKLGRFSCKIGPQIP